MGRIDKEVRVLSRIEFDGIFLAALFNHLGSTSKIVAGQSARSSGRLQVRDPHPNHRRAAT